MPNKLVPPHSVTRCKLRQATKISFLNGHRMRLLHRNALTCARSGLRSHPDLGALARVRPFCPSKQPSERSFGRSEKGRFCCKSRSVSCPRSSAAFTDRILVLIGTVRGIPFLTTVL